MTYYGINSENAIAEYSDQEVLAINLTIGHYYSLRSSSYAIWRLLTDGYSIEELQIRIAQIYNIETEVAVKDISRFIHELLENELIVELANPVNKEDSDWIASLIKKYEEPVLEIHTDMIQLAAYAVGD